MHAQARACVSTRIWWVVGGLNCGLNFHLISFEPHPLGKVYNPVCIAASARPHGECKTAIALLGN